MNRVFLLPGEYHISKKPEIVETLVGSCVSVCLFNIKTGRAAMNHFLQDQPSLNSESNIGNFGSTATEYIITTLMKIDSNPGHYRGQIFGGAAVVKNVSNHNIIGKNNIEIAQKILSQYRIRVIREETGGERGRRIRFDTSNNNVFCRFAGQVGKKYNKPESISL